MLTRLRILDALVTEDEAHSSEVGSKNPLDGPSLADELIAERREEAEAETRRDEILKGLEEAERDIPEGRSLSWEEQKAKLREWRR